ncbi:MAG: PGPGW domain-containing protein [Acidobacteriota bacterium]
MDHPPRDPRLDHRSTRRRGKGSLLRLIFGWVLLVIGLILAIPFVPGPGFIFVLGGLGLLSSESRAIRRLLRRLREWRLLRRAMREAERVGVRLDLDDDEQDERPGPPPVG